MSCRRRHKQKVTDLIKLCLVLSPLMIYTYIAVQFQKTRSIQDGRQTGLTGRSSGDSVQTLLGIGTTYRDRSKIPFTAAVLVFAAKRPLAIDNHLKQLIRLRPSPEAFPIIVSQDCCHAPTRNAIARFKDQQNLTSIQHSGNNDSAAYKAHKSYYLISQHYRWALDYVFTQRNYTTAIITEDDLDVSDDFFLYFNATAPLLKRDNTIMCVSAWNDNGQDQLTDRDALDMLHRTDFFPGLGWMLTRELWLELRDNWPVAYWDDWLREADVRRNRSCIRPEVSRTAHNMKLAGKGSSNAMYKTYLSGVHLPLKPIDFAQLNLDYLLKTNYDARLEANLNEANDIDLNSIIAGKLPAKPHTFKLNYSTPREFRALASHFGLMKDVRGGMPRTVYNGVVEFFFCGCRGYLYNQNGVYNATWDRMTRYLDFAEHFCTPKKYTGKCDPYDKAMIDWFAAKKWSKQLTIWGKDMIVN